MHNNISIQIFIVYNRLSYQRETFFLTCDFTQIQQIMYKIKKKQYKNLAFQCIWGLFKVVWDKTNTYALINTNGKDFSLTIQWLCSVLQEG